ncbi:MAG: hypothetical protein HUU55_24040 [Myxococcales bacterium]|nr:hypothetical protein [Myxococcales bacterium]
MSITFPHRVFVILLYSCEVSDPSGKDATSANVQDVGTFDISDLNEFSCHKREKIVGLESSVIPQSPAMSRICVYLTTFDVTKNSQYIVDVRVNNGNPVEAILMPEGHFRAFVDPGPVGPFTDVVTASLYCKKDPPIDAPIHVLRRDMVFVSPPTCPEAD